MRIRNISLTILLLLQSLFFAQPVMELWKPLLKQKGLAEYFSGVFKNLGVRVAESGEAFTVVHKGDLFELKPGIVKEEVDYEVTINSGKVRNMVSHGDDGKIDDAESFRIMKVLFTPMTLASLNNPVLTKRRYLRIAGVDEIMHVTF